MTSPPSDRGVFDPLHPCIFLGTSHQPGQGLSLRELTFVGACLQHYRRPGHSARWPMPLPLVHRLQALAKRPLTAAEQRLEAHLALPGHHLRRRSPGLESPQGPAVPSGLQPPLGEPGWLAPHVAPPLAAAWLLTSERVSWFDTLPEDRATELLERLEAFPARYGWLCRAALHDAARLRPVLLTQLAATWEKLTAPASDPTAVVGTPAQMPLSPVFVCMLGGAALPALDQEQMDRLLTQLEQTPPRWHYGLYDSWLQLVEHVGLSERWQQIFRHGLMSLDAPARDTDETLRHTLAARLLSRASGSRLPARRDALRELVSIVSRPPLDSSRLLWDELERLGFSKQAQANAREVKLRA